MKHTSNHFYRDGVFHHLYIKALYGRVLFYRTEDYLFLYTLFSKLAWRYEMKVEAFCIMFNHIHACLKAPSEDEMRSFCRDLSSLFTIGFNIEYNRQGKLLMPCGYAAKVPGKALRSCLVYIANNPSTGRITQKAIEYKWNLLKYFLSNCPFSEKLVKRESRFEMRQSLAIVDGCFRRGRFLNYTILNRVFAKLTNEEKLQMVDYIIVKYFFIDRQGFLCHFGGLNKTLVAIDSSSGSEHDFYEPWEDYSVYLTMLRKTKDSGLDYKGFRFHEMQRKDLIHLRRRLFTVNGATNKHVERFLHLEETASWY